MLRLGSAPCGRGSSLCTSAQAHATLRQGRSFSASAAVMGIKNFNKMVQRFAPGVVQKSFNPGLELRGKKVAIDAPIYLYRATMVESRGRALELYHSNTESDGSAPPESTILMNPLKPLLRTTVRLLNYGAIPIFVKDNSAAPLAQKEQEREKRKTARLADRQRVKDVVSELSEAKSKRDAALLPGVSLDQQADALKSAAMQMIETVAPKDQRVLRRMLKRGDQSVEALKTVVQAVESKSTNRLYVRAARTLKPGKRDWEHLENMLALLGIPLLTAEHEAEALCASLNSEGLVDYVATEDSDIFAFGDCKVVRGLDRRMEFIDGARLREELRLSREQFVELAILMGCDFSNGLKNVGYVRAVQLLREHGSLDSVMEAKGYEPTHSFRPDTARELFLQRVEIPEEHHGLIEQARKCPPLDGIDAAQELANEYSIKLRIPLE